MQVSEPLGLRERKKEQTRQLIAETARRLFAERGFEQVTVAQIARAADVAEQTVYNYFPTKEDLVYWRLESFEQELLAAIATARRACRCSRRSGSGCCDRAACWTSSPSARDSSRSRA